MSLQVLYSFDHITTVDLTSLPNVIGAGSGCIVSQAEGRDSSGCLSTTSILNANLGLNPGFNFSVEPHVDYSIGAWVVIEDTPAPNAILLGFGNPAANLTSVSSRLISLSPAQDGSLRVWAAEVGQNGALIATSAPGVLSYGANRAHYIEMRVILDANGLVQVRVDGNFVINLAPIVTRYFDANTVTHIMLGNPVGSPRTRYDDIYVVSGHNIGDGWHGGTRGVIQIDGKRVAAAGEVTQWTPTTPTGINFENVREETPDQNTYNTAITLGVIDLYNLDDITYAPTALQLDLYMKKTGSGPSVASPIVRPVPGGANFTGNPQSLTTDFKYYKQVYTKNPAGAGDWTMAAYNQLQVGVVKAE